MAQKTFSTTTNGITGVCDYTTSISGTYPNVKFNFNYTFKLKLTYAENSIYGTFTFNFHTNKHVVTVNLAGAGTSAILAEGSLSLDFGGNRSCTHTLGIGISSSFINGSTNLVATQTIPSPKMNASVKEVTHDNVSFNIDLSNNPNEFYKVKIYNTEGLLYVDNATDGANISGLEEETEYTFHVETWCKNDSGSCVTQVKLNVTTETDQAKFRIKIDGKFKLGKAYTRHNGTWVKCKKMYFKDTSWKRSV